MKKSSIKSDVSSSNHAIIGTFEGECADSNITNLNGLDITREVWETVFASDEYKKGIELGHYLGYLGHPDDPADQNHMNACIVMTDGWIDDNGKVYGKFNLVDTPVGQIVKKFIDAGVTFGISVRGAGDIINNSVDPETFVFRGFDLVTFPAFPESIPTFTEIAASSDADKQQKYKAICATVNKNIDSLNTVQSVEVIQSCFAKQSDTYKKLDQRKAEISKNSSISSIDDDRVNGMTDLYLSASAELEVLRKETARLRKVLANKSSMSLRKMKSIERIMCSQMDDMSSQIDDIESENGDLKSKIKVVQSENLKYKRKVEASKKLISDKDSEIARLSEIVASKQEELDSITSELDSKESILASTKTKLQSRESELDRLQADLDETVRKNSDIEASASNFDEQISDLTSQVSEMEDQINDLNEEITSAYSLIEDYQNEYARLYASAVGVDLAEVSGSITASTTVSQLKKMISGNTARESRGRVPKPVEIPQSNNTLVTL